MTCPGFPIGMIDEAEYDESVIELQPGDRLYLHSDGLTEEVNAQDESSAMRGCSAPSPMARPSA